MIVNDLADFRPALKVFGEQTNHLELGCNLMANTQHSSFVRSPKDTQHPDPTKEYIPGHLSLHDLGLFPELSSSAKRLVMSFAAEYDGCWVHQFHYHSRKMKRRVVIGWIFLAANDSCKYSVLNNHVKVGMVTMQNIQEFLFRNRQADHIPLWKVKPYIVPVNLQVDYQPTGYERLKKE